MVGARHNKNNKLSNKATCLKVWLETDFLLCLHLYIFGIKKKHFFLMLMQAREQMKLFSISDFHFLFILAFFCFCFGFHLLNLIEEFFLLLLCGKILHWIDVDCDYYYYFYCCWCVSVLFSFVSIFKVQHLCNNNKWMREGGNYLMRIYCIFG